MNPTYPIIAISGPPGSGKTAFARKLQQRLDATVIDMDDYQSFTDQSIDDIVNASSQADFYDHFVIPDLADDLLKLKKGELVTSPGDKTPQRANGPIIFETHFGKAHQDTGQHIDTLIWLQCPLDLALARKIGVFLQGFSQQGQEHHSQHIAWLNQYLEQYQHGVRATLDLQADTVARAADITLDAQAPLDDMLEHALNALAQTATRAKTMNHIDYCANIGNETDYLCVEPFLREFVQVQVLKGAFEVGLIDALERDTETTASLQEKTAADRAGLQFLLASLRQHGVIEPEPPLRLTPAFTHTLQFRDLIDAKIEFSNLLAPDLVDNMAAFVSDEAAFMQSSRLFELFDYHRAIESSADNYRFTKRWMDLTTALTRYEAGVCLAQHDFSSYQRVMDIGGNSGELMLQTVQQHSSLLATVIDLPVVCEVGRNHVANSSAAARIEFYPANALADPLPGQQCAVTFKSILHDWPIEACQQFILQAARALKPGGDIIIFERSAIDFDEFPASYGSLPTALFYRSYRPASDYYPLLQSAGLEVVELKHLRLETNFHLICARKGS